MAKPFASPLARRLAKEAGLDLESIRGTGPRGRVLARDVQGQGATSLSSKSAPSSPSPPPATHAPAAAAPNQSADPRLFYTKDSYEEVALDNMRRAIASRLAQAKREIPHIYLSSDYDVAPLLALRADVNKALDGEKVSLNDLVVKCVALALMKEPDVNVSFAGGALLKHKSADVSVAVAIDGGLITPIVKRAHEKGFLAISREIKDLASRAKAKKLKPEEYEGGTFSVSNMGMFDIDSFCAIINPPQAAILAVGAAKECAVVKDGALAIGKIMTVTLSCDHRAIDGALGAKFLKTLKGIIEQCPIAALV